MQTKPQDVEFIFNRKKPPPHPGALLLTSRVKSDPVLTLALLLGFGCLGGFGFCVSGCLGFFKMLILLVLESVGSM